MRNIILKGLILMLVVSSCKKDKTETAPDQETQKEMTAEDQKPFFKLSLAQWSLNKAIRGGEMSPYDFAQKASEMGFEGIEYVSQLYSEELKKDPDPQVAMRHILDTLKAKSEEYKVQNLIIMIDHEGDLADIDEAARDQAVENHKKWVDAAAFLGCHSIRVNLFGTDDPVQWRTTAADGLSKLSDYAAAKNINVIVENHGYLSSNAALLTEVIRNVNKPNCGTLPDFGNFCLEREDGERWGAKCISEYPKYQGVEEMMPYAKAVSAKSYDFDAEGNETTIDYKKMLDIIKAAGYTGFIGVEYEGNRLGEPEGIIATRDLLIDLGKNMDQPQ